MLQTYLSVAIYTIFIENYVWYNFWESVPFMGVSKDGDRGWDEYGGYFHHDAAATWAANKFILIPYELEYLQTITFILIIATLVQFIELFLKNPCPPCIRRWESICR